jgi:hypothetical protein
MLFSGQVGNGKSDAALGESRKGRTAGGVFGGPVPDVGHANLGGPSVNVKLIVAIEIRWGFPYPRRARY